MQKAPICGMEVVEVSPPYDHAQITSLLASALVFEFMSLMGF
jgi:agmatinase